MRHVRFIRFGLALIAAFGGAQRDSTGADGVTGFSAYGTSSGAGASATTGIPFGPSQRSRRPPVAPRELPAAPPNALPAAAPPRDPYFDMNLIGGRPLVEPIALLSPGAPASSPQAGTAPVAGPVFPPAETVPGTPPAPLTVPAPTPGYGSPSLGYGPQVNYAPPPSFTPDSFRGQGAPPASGPVLAAPQLAPPQPPMAGTATVPPGAQAWPATPPLPPPPPQAILEPDERMPSWQDLPEGPDRRFYLASILGADYGTLSVGDGPNPTDALFTAGGAAGIAFERPQGWMRTEFEARYRDPVSLTQSDPTLGGSASVTARDGWSTMINAWRDLEVTDRVALYLGGGIGGGGYTVDFDGGFPALDVTLSGSTAVTGFAWQAGGGGSWLVTERFALDLGYRWYAVDGGPAAINVTTPIFSFSDGIGTRYGASELLFTIRVYEPFRRWGY